MTYNEELKSYNAIKKIGEKIKVLEELLKAEENKNIIKSIKNLIYEYEKEQDKISKEGTI